MGWKTQNIITSIFSPLLFIGTVVAYIYSDINKVANAFFYILLIGTIISNISGIIVNLMEIKDTKDNYSKAAFGSMIFTTILQIIITIIIIIPIVSRT